jgi:nicotinate phosphoribosyltransferase
MSYESERQAFQDLQKLLGPETVQLVDTYDTIHGARLAAEVGRPLWGIRLDSGDLAALSRQARAILDAAGLNDARIMASSDLDETRIAALVAAGAPIDAFGVGTELATSGDAPSMGAIYKLVEIEGRPVAKRSEGKGSLPGAKQLYRFPDRDLLALAAEPAPPGGEALLRPVILRGQSVEGPPPLDQIRQSVRIVPPRPVERSAALRDLSQTMTS